VRNDVAVTTQMLRGSAARLRSSVIGWNVGGL
jgi:hypothetical protein